MHDGPILVPHVTAVRAAAVDPAEARSRAHGNGRKHFYGCASYHERGRTVCGNNADVPMVDADDIVIEALLDDVLDATVLEDSVSEALRLLQGEAPEDRTRTIEGELATVEQERSRLVAAIAAGGQLDALVQALQAREARRRELETRREHMHSERRLRASDAARVRDELMALATAWRRVLVDDPRNARPIVSSLLKGRVTIEPVADARKRWTLRGEGTLIGLFQAVIPGKSFPLVWRPQRDSNPCFGLERATSWASGRWGRSGAPCSVTRTQHSSTHPPADRPRPSGTSCTLCVRRREWTRSVRTRSGPSAKRPAALEAGESADGPDATGRRGNARGDCVSS